MDKKNVNDIIFFDFPKNIILKFKNYKLEKKQKYLTIISTPKINIPKTNYDESKILKKLYGEHLLYFVKTVTEKMSHCDLSFLYKNFPDVKIKKSSFILNKINPIIETLGTYNIPNNKVSLKNEKSIYHEFFHLSSSYYLKSKKIVFSGFIQSNKNYSIGSGIDEGYTQLLSERYFHDKNINYSYPFVKIIASSIEDIIGKEKMEQLYMKADLYNFIKELEKYNNTEEKTIKFIKDIDFVGTNINKVDILSDHKLKQMYYKMNNILTFLVNSLFVKSNQLHDDDDKLLYFKNSVMKLIENGEYNLGGYKPLKFALSKVNELEKNKSKIKKL